MADFEIIITCAVCKRTMDSTSTGGLYDRIELVNPDEPCDDCKQREAQKIERIHHMRKLHERKKGWFDV